MNFLKQKEINYFPSKCIKFASVKTARAIWDVLLEIMLERSFGQVCREAEATAYLLAHQMIAKHDNLYICGVGICQRNCGGGDQEKK
jgi:hypothetical protein